jgi:hypothetical protein
MRRLHLVVGLGGVVAFLLSGQYMDRVHNHLADMEPTPRLLFRSTHIYLLLASLVNLALGLYLTPTPSPWRTWLRHAGSVLVLAAPVLLAIGFFVEPWLTDLERPYTRPTLYGTLVGMLVHTFTALRARPAGRFPPE